MCMCESPKLSGLQSSMRLSRCLEWLSEVTWNAAAAKLPACWKSVSPLCSSTALKKRFACLLLVVQGGHKPGKHGIIRDFSEHGKLREFCATSGKNCNKQSVFSSSFKYLVNGQSAVVNCYICWS